MSVRQEIKKLRGNGPSAVKTDMKKECNFLTRDLAGKVLLNRYILNFALPCNRCKVYIDWRIYFPGFKLKYL